MDGLRGPYHVCDSVLWLNRVAIPRTGEAPWPTTRLPWHGSNGQREESRSSSSLTAFAQSVPHLPWSASLRPADRRVVTRRGSEWKAGTRSVQRRKARGKGIIPAIPARDERLPVGTVRCAEYSGPATPGLLEAGCVRLLFGINLVMICAKWH